jgi:hypothetical protein
MVGRAVLVHAPSVHDRITSWSRYSDLFAYDELTRTVTAVSAS